MPEKTKTISFNVREHYTVEGDDGLKCREVEIAGTETENWHGDSVYHLTRTDTGDNIYPFQLSAFEMIGERTYLAISGHGGWGRSESLKEALENMLSASGLTKAQARKLDVVRSIAVYECVKDTGYVTGMGGAAGLMLTPTKATNWLYELWELVKPKPKR